jgi:3-hydroxybutyryl-CoA dehydratase
MEQGKTIDQLNIGEKASLTKQITESDVLRFAEVTGDRNPIHLDPEYANKTRFKERIAHGMLTASLISAVISTRLLGPGNIYVSQSLEFKAPVKLGDVIQAEVELIEKIPEKNRVRLKTTCRNQDGTVVIDGEAIALPRRG